MAPRSRLAAPVPMAAVWLLAPSALAACWGSAEAAHVFNAEKGKDSSSSSSSSLSLSSLVEEALAVGADVARNGPATRIIRSVDIQLAQHESESADDGALEKASTPGVHSGKAPFRRDGGDFAPAPAAGPNAPAASTSTSAYVKKEPQSDAELLEAFRTTCTRLSDEAAGNMVCKSALQTLSQVDLTKYKQPSASQMASQTNLKINEAFKNVGKVCPAEYAFEAFTLLIMSRSVIPYLLGLARSNMEKAALGMEGGILKLGRHVAETMLVWRMTGLYASWEVRWAACKSSNVDVAEVLDPWVQSLFGNDVEMGVVAARRLGQIFMASHRTNSQLPPVPCREKIRMVSKEQLQKAWDSKDLAGAVREVACQEVLKSRVVGSGGRVKPEDWKQCNDLDPADLDPEPFEDFSDEEIDDLWSHEGE